MSANPFITESNGSKGSNRVEWTTNELILSDPQMRKKAGIATLDAAMLDVTSMRGGGAINAPFYDPRAQWDGPSGYSANNVPYSTTIPLQSGGMPMRYFNSDAKW